MALAGLTITPGLYTNATAVLISGGNLTLDAQGDSNAIFIFQIGTTLITDPGTEVLLAGGATAANVFWQVGSSATLDTTTIFKGSIFAATSITMNTGATTDGRIFAGSAGADGAVTLDTNAIAVPN